MDTYLPKQKKINSLKNEGDTFSSPPPPSVTLWRPLATLGDTFASTPASKNRFRNIPTRNRATCASGFGVPPPPSPPPKLAKKKKFQKKFRTRPPPLPLLIGNRRERSEKISRSDKKDRWSSGGPRNLTKPPGDLELSPGRRSSRSLKRALVRLLQPNPHRAPKVNQSNQTSLHRYLPWPIISTLTS